VSDIYKALPKSPKLTIQIKKGKYHSFVPLDAIIINSIHVRLVSFSAITLCIASHW